MDRIACTLAAATAELPQDLRPGGLPAALCLDLYEPKTPVSRSTEPRRLVTFSSKGLHDAMDLRTSVPRALLLSIGALLALSLSLHAQVQNELLWRVKSPNGAWFGFALASLGDMNRDRFTDVVMGDNSMLYVLSGTDGSVVYTLQELDVRYQRLGSLADLDRDGVNDFVAGFPMVTVNNAQQAGRAVVFSGKTGKTLFAVNGTCTGEALGSVVGDAGDVDGDGIADVLVAADGGGGSSTVFVPYVAVYSGADWRLLLRLTGLPAPVSGAFGAEACGLGDVDGDNCSDILVSRPFALGGGCVDVFSGKTGRLIYTVKDAERNAWFGLAATGIGDIDGDGANDWIAGSRNWGGGSGQAQVFSGKTGKRLYAYFGGAYDVFGIEVAGGFDVNADHVPDFAVAAGQALNCARHDKAVGPGYVNLYSGKDGSLLGTISGNPGGLGKWFGWQIASGFFDGDPFVDLVIGAPGAVGGGEVTTHSLLPPPSITLSAAPKIGTSIQVNVKSIGDPGLTYAVGFAAGTSPGVRLRDGRVIPLNCDWLLPFSLSAGNPIFRNTIGLLDSAGATAIQFNIPNAPLLVGYDVYTGLVVVEPRAPLGVRRISKVVPIRME